MEVSLEGSAVTFRLHKEGGCEGTSVNAKEKMCVVCNEIWEKNTRRVDKEEQTRPVALSE